MNGYALRPTSLLEMSRRAEAGLQRFDPALREFLDEFYADPLRRPEAIAEQPVHLDDVKDAYLAATAEHLAGVYHLDLPVWTEHHGQPLKRAFFAGGLESIKAALTVESPAAFRRRLLFVSKNALFRPDRGERDGC